MSKIRRYRLPDDWAQSDQAYTRPAVDLYTCFYSQPRLRSYFEKLDALGIEDLEDLKNFTLEELNDLCPMDEKTENLFKQYIKNGVFLMKGQTIAGNLSMG